MRLGVFDSGIGGEAIAAALRKTFPNAQIDTINDRDHVPYGNYSSEEIIRLTETAIQPFLAGDYDIIVLACNTATAAAIQTLRSRYPHQKFIGIEPMIKMSAELTRSGTVAVFATPATLKSDRYQRLVQKYGSQIEIIEPDCRDWAYLIENNRMNRTHIEATINDICDRGADVIVLGCTHYHWIKDLVTEIADGRATIIEPSDAIGRRVTELLAEQPSHTKDIVRNY